MGKDKAKRVFSYKRCPYCFTSLGLDAETCHSCRKRVRKVDRFGLARKPINYLGYLAALTWLAIFLGYIWFVFIR